ncbi:MAG: hypothetical protein AAFV98_19665 [Chloroflexota bacterium]
MPIKVGWYIEEKVTYLQLIGDFTNKSFIEAANYCSQLARSSSTEQVHLIVDVTNATSGIEINSFRKLEVPPNGGWTMIVGSADGIARFTGSVMFQLLKQKFKFVDTLEESIDELIDIDTSLAPKQANYDIIIRKEFD